MSSLAQRLIAVRPLNLPLWLRHAMWFAMWWVTGFVATLVIISW